MKYSLVVLLFLIAACSANRSGYTVKSPDSKIVLTVKNDEGRIYYSVTKNGKPVINPSLVGIKLKGINNGEMKITGSSSSSFDKTWKPVYGPVNKVRNHYNELTLEVQGGIKFNIIFRAYDDGVAIRYSFPAQKGNADFVIEDDQTHFTLATNATIWAANGERHNYGPVASESIESDKNLLTPVVAKIYDDCYVGLLEAAIYEFDYFTLKHTKGTTFKCTMDPSKGKFPAHTSWRAIKIGDSPGDLIVSNLLPNLNPPDALGDVSWIKPGKSMWDWRVWGYKTAKGFEYGLNTTSQLRLIDFAAKNNIQYLLMDADWYGAEFSEESDPTSANKNINIHKNFSYANEKGIGIILYLNDVGAKKFGLERILKQFADWGASGVKYGFMKGVNQEKVLYTRKVVDMCAKYKLLVDFHDGPVPPSGDNRTYPNLVTREYCHSQADAKRSYWPETAVTSPFVNGIAGYLDLCDGWYDLEGAESRVRVFEPIPGTVAAENAKLVVNYGGLKVLPDAPEEYNKKADLFEFIRVLPNTFDEVKIFNDVIGESITVARRAGDQWFIGSLTNREGRTLNIPLNFLDPGTKYDITLYEDAKDTNFETNKEAYSIRKMQGDTKTVIKAELAPGGGQAIWIRPAK